MIDALPPTTTPVRYAIPAERLPALSAKYEGNCHGVAPSVPMTEGRRGYRMVICGELGTWQTILSVNPFTGRLTVDVRAVR